MTFFDRFRSLLSTVTQSKELPHNSSEFEDPAGTELPKHPSSATVEAAAKVEANGRTESKHLASRTPASCRPNSRSQATYD